MRKEILAKKEYKKPVARFVVFNYRDIVMASDSTLQVKQGAGDGSGTGSGDGNPQDEVED